MLISVVLSLFTNNLKTIISKLTSQRLSHNIQTTVAAKFQKIPQRTIDTPDFQNLYKNTTEKVLTVPMSIAETLFGLILNVIGRIGYISIISILNIFAVILMIGLTIPIYFLKGKSRNLEFDFLKDHTTLALDFLAQDYRCHLPNTCSKFLNLTLYLHSSSWALKGTVL